MFIKHSLSFCFKIYNFCFHRMCLFFVWNSPTLLMTSLLSVFVLECHWVSVWSFADRCSLLSVFWSASHCSGQHWASSSFWEDSFQVLQVRETHFQQNVTTFLILFLVHFTLHYVIFTFENICWESGRIYVILSLSAFYKICTDYICTAEIIYEIIY